MIQVEMSYRDNKTCDLSKCESMIIPTVHQRSSLHFTALLHFTLLLNFTSPQFFTSLHSPLFTPSTFNSDKVQISRRKVLSSS